MAKFDLHKAQGINNVMNAVQQVKSVNSILPLTEAKELLIENVYPSKENFYSVEELDELSASIRDFGILQPLLVSERGKGYYEIIAGNRRYEAAKMAGLERLPCVIKQNIEPALFKIMLIHANMFRIKSDMERATEVAELKKAIILLKSSDKSIKGSTSEIAGQILNLSYRQVNRLDNLNKLIPEIQGLVQSERLTASCAEQFANLEENIQKEIYEALINSGMDINRQEAAKLREEFQAKSREMEARSETDIVRFKEQICEEQKKLKEKEQELEILTKQVYEQEAWEKGNPSLQQAQSLSNNSKLDLQERKEIDKVKQALVAALQDRKEIEDRYNELLRLTSTLSAGTSGMIVTEVDARKLISDVKRKVQLRECIEQLKQALRLYDEYKILYHSVSHIKPSDDETALISELVRDVNELFKLVTEEQRVITQ